MVGQINWNIEENEDIKRKVNFSDFFQNMVIGYTADKVIGFRVSEDGVYSIYFGDMTYFNL